MMLVAPSRNRGKGEMPEGADTTSQKTSDINSGAEISLYP